MPPLLSTSSSKDSSRDSASNQDTEASTGSGANEDGLDNEDRPVTELKKNEESQRKRQPALEQEEGPSSDEDPDSTYDTESHEYNVQQASQLSASSLYQSYLEKLRRKAENSTKKKDQGSKLVKNFIDYVRVLEERIGHLESKALASEAPKSSEVLSPESTKSESPEDKAEVGEELVEKSEVTGKWADVAHETRFFHADNELNGDGVYNYLNPSRKDTYTSTNDSKHVLRVLYDWAEDLSQVPSCGPSDEQPKPEQIDLLEISVTSEPIASFFRKRFDLENLNRPSLVRIAKPFRPLLRNLDPLREQLAKLEKSFGSEDGKQASNRSKDSEEGQHTQQPHERDAADDDLPFAPGSEQEHTEVEAFDCQEALPHFQLLLTLVDNYLAKQISLLNVMKSGQHEKIAFENLWMLFDTGDTIYCPSRDGGLVLQNDEDESHTTKRRDVPQAYQVVATDGGTPQRKAFARKPKDMVLDVARFRLLPENDSSRKRDALPAEGMKHKYIPLFVYCFYIDYDGIKYGTVTEIFVFKPYEGVVDIQTLEAYPLQYLEAKKPSYCVPANLMTGHAGDLPILQKEHDKQDIDFLLERGRKFIDMTAVSHMHMTYEGLTVGESREEVNSPVIVDFRLAFTEYKQLFQNSESIVPTFSPLTDYWNSIKHTRVSEFTRDPMCNCCPSSDAWATEQRSRREKVEKKVKMTLEDFEFEKSSSSYEGFKHYLEASNLIKLLPGIVPGFALRHRKWIQADLNLLKAVREENSWNELVLPDGHKEMVQAMVETYAKDSDSTTQQVHEKVEMDLVRGKGKGCIILLHGAPGVGKTSTAECVAVYTKRPLYPITCGDIGYLPEAVEKNMERHFKLAHKWGCVLLLDEADVFLAKRSKEDIKRNGLVSVFLRILEYYSGILFLTTNRVGAIDDAFRSRLHLTLYYPKLTKKQTIKIWERNLEHMKSVNEERKGMGQLAITYKRKAILEFVEKNWKVLSWNGRQIRNAFQTAIALGEFKAKSDTSELETKSPSLSIRQFKIIATASVQFNHYLRETHGVDEDTVAKRDMIRSVKDSIKVKFKGDTSDESESSSDGSDDDAEDESEEGNANNSEDISDSDEKAKNVKKRSKKASKIKSTSSKEKIKDRKRK